MDSVCKLEQDCLSAVANPHGNSYFILIGPPLEICEVDLDSLHTLQRFSVEINSSSNPTLKVHQDKLYLFGDKGEISVFEKDSGAYFTTLSCGGKIQYVPYAVAFLENSMVFSSLSHTNVYVFCLSTLYSHGVIKKPLKLKLPPKVEVRKLQAANSLVFGACSDGVIRVWNLETKDELLAIVDTAPNKPTKKAINSLIKSGELKAVEALELLSGRMKLLSGDEGGLISVWNCENPKRWELESNLRVCEQGILGLAWASETRILSLIREGSLILLELVANSEYVSKKQLQFKLKVMSQGLYSIPEQIRKPFTPRELTCLFSLESLIVLWPYESKTRLMLLDLYSSTHPTEIYPITSQLPQQSVECLVQDPVDFPCSFCFLNKNQVCEYKVKDGKSTEVCSLQEEEVYSLDVRENNNTKEVLVCKEQNKIILVREGTQKEFTGTSAAFMGEVGENLLILSEDRARVFLVFLSNNQTESYPLSMKVKSVWRTPLQESFAVLYETLFDRSLVLSKSAKTGRVEDLDLSEKEVLKLRYDETLTSAKWGQDCLAFATTKRICLADSNLTLLKSFNLDLYWKMPISLYWYGNLLLFSTTEAVFYFEDSPQMLFNTIWPSVICGVLNDRVILAKKSGLQTEVLARPVTMLEPLVKGFLRTQPQIYRVNNLVRMLSTNQFSEDLLELLLDKNYLEAAWFLMKYSSGFVSLRTKVKILKKMTMFEELLSIVTHGKEFRNFQELKHFLAELQADHNWKLERLLLEELSQVFLEFSQNLKAAKCMELTGQYMQLYQLLQPLMSSNERFPESVILNAPSCLQDSSYSPLVPQITPIKVGYGEAAFSQTTNKQVINLALAENLGQWFGFNSLKEPQRHNPQFMDHSFPEDEESLHAYFRCDEGKGSYLEDVVSERKWEVEEEIWGDMLEDGEPLDHDDKWGKSASPNYALELQETSLVLEGLDPGDSWTLEVWVKPYSSDTRVFRCNFDLELLNKRIKVQECQLEDTLEVHYWTHVSIVGNKKHFKVLVNSKLAFKGNKALELGEKLDFSGFEGAITEIRLWKGCLSEESIRENFKCPLEMLAEKKRKKWSKIKIKKEGGPKLPSGTKPAPLGLKPPSALKTTPRQPLKVTPRQPAQTSFVADFSQNNLSATPKKHSSNPIEEAYTLFENKNYAEALSLLEEASQQLLNKIKENPQENTKAKAFLEHVSLYKFALKVLIEVISFETNSVKRAAFYNLLIQLKLKSDHRKALALEAIDSNMEVQNYGIAAKIAEGLLPHSSSQEHCVLSEKLEECQKSQNQNLASNYSEVAKQAQEHFMSIFNKSKT